MDYYNCLRNQLNCEYAFCNQGICKTSEFIKFSYLLRIKV